MHFCLSSGHPEATPLKLHSCACAMYERNVSKFIVCTAKPHTRYKEALFALENVCVQVSCIQMTRKKCVLARQLIGLLILHINKQERQLYLTIYPLTHEETSLHYLYSTPLYNGWDELEVNVFQDWAGMEEVYSNSGILILHSINSIMLCITVVLYIENHFFTSDFNLC